jgi:bicarbonate transport system substrate-binding protein
MISEGAITNGKKVPMVILAMLMSQGNGIAASNAVKDGNLIVDLKTSSPGFFDKFSQKQGRKFKAAYTFPKANQEICIRYWLVAGGVNPDQAGGTAQGAGTGNLAGHEERHDGGLLHR